MDDDTRCVIGVNALLAQHPAERSRMAFSAGLSPRTVARAFSISATIRERRSMAHERSNGSFPQIGKALRIPIPTEK
jgi:hypothetical protein